MLVVEGVWITWVTWGCTGRLEALSSRSTTAEPDPEHLPGASSIPASDFFSTYSITTPPPPFCPLSPFPKRWSCPAR